MIQDHAYFLSQGYGVEKVILDKDLAEGLALLAVEIAKGYYRRTRVIPADAALEQSKNFRPDEDSHLVYAILSQKHPYRVARKTRKVARLLIPIVGVDASSRRHEQTLHLERAK